MRTGPEGLEQYTAYISRSAQKPDTAESFSRQRASSAEVSLHRRDNVIVLPENAVLLAIAWHRRSRLASPRGNPGAAVTLIYITV